MKLSGRTILISGGTRGIGFEFASQLGRRGAKIIITGQSEASVAAAKAKLPGAAGFICDLADPGSIAALAQSVTAQFPDLDILINNAGLGRMIDLREPQPDLTTLTDEVTVNFSRLVRMTAAFLPRLLTRPEAAIVNISSGLAFVPLPAMPIYCATKAATHSYTLSLRAQLEGSKNIRVFEVTPPATRTDLLAGQEPPGVPIMNPDKMVEASIKGLEADTLEIRVGQSNALKFMNRVAPDFIHRQLAKGTSAMLAALKG